MTQILIQELWKIVGEYIGLSSVFDLAFFRFLDPSDKILSLMVASKFNIIKIIELLELPETSDLERAFKFRRAYQAEYHPTIRYLTLEFQPLVLSKNDAFDAFIFALEMEDFQTALILAQISEDTTIGIYSYGYLKRMNISKESKKAAFLIDNFLSPTTSLTYLVKYPELEESFRKLVRQTVSKKNLKDREDLERIEEIIAAIDNLSENPERHYSIMIECGISEKLLGTEVLNRIRRPQYNLT